MVTKNRKTEQLEELKTKFAEAKSVYTTKQNGLTVAEISALRKELRAVAAEFKIAKNTLIGLAAKGTDYESITDGMTGPTALLLCNDDTIAPAGIVKKFSKDNAEKIEFEAGFLDGEVLDSEKVNKVAGLPSKDVLLAQIAGMLVQPLSSMAYIIKELSEKEGGETLLKEFLVASGEATDTEAKADVAAESSEAASTSAAAEEPKTAAEPEAKAEGEAKPEEGEKGEEK